MILGLARKQPVWFRRTSLYRRSNENFSLAASISGQVSNGLPYSKYQDHTVILIHAFAAIYKVFGALGSHYFTDRYGRRRTFIVAAIGFIIGVLIQAFAPSFTILMIGRVFVGLGVGVGLAVSFDIRACL
jgi:predicted MFS family arabinose efflux permease